MAAVLAVKALTMFSVGRMEKEIHDLNGDDKDVTAKIDELDGTRALLEREHKDIVSDFDRLENQKNQLVMSIQKFGAVPVDQPSRVTPAETGPVASTHPSDDQIETVEDTGGAPEGPTSDPADSLEVGQPAEQSLAESAEGEARILVVDDNAELRDLLAEAFGKSNLVDRAADGLEALQLILKQKISYDVVVTDLNMPNIDGMTFLENLPEGTKAIVMSAYMDRPEFAPAAEHPRVCRAIAKPFKLGEIKEAVAREVAPKTEAIEPVVVDEAAVESVEQ